MKTEFIRVKQFVICLNFATPFRKRKRGGRNGLKILKVSHFSIFKNETSAVFPLKEGLCFMPDIVILRRRGQEVT